ncbi:MAG TPA: hypothetical protein VEL74_21000 [Thermoanaerobaculia bacterium]|nr:hypothetical protein [Thermoanaerobaculia bacterium]
MLEWADVWKILLGFASSLILIWIKELFVHYRQVVGLQKSLWSMMEFESDLEEFLAALERMKASISEGNMRLVAFDVPKSITSAAEELAHLEPKNAYIYNDLQTHAEIVRSGLTLLRELLKSLATMKPNPDDEIRLRKAIIGQVDILRSDRLSLGRAEVRVMEHIKGCHPGLNKATVDKMNIALAKFNA